MSYSECKIIIASDSEYEEVVAEVYIGDVFVALISQDKGRDNLEIIFESYAKITGVARIGFEGFISALHEAKRILLEE